MKYIFPLIIAILSLTGCHKKQTTPEYEQEVMHEVFPELIDSLYPKPYPHIPPPPPIPEADSAQIAEALTKYKTFKAKLKSGTIKHIVAIIDSAYTLEATNSTELTKHFATLNLSPDTTDLSSAYKIDIDKLKNNRNLLFKYRSELPEYNKWKSTSPFIPKEIIGFSRIRFDTTKSYGVFLCDLYCGKLCAQGMRVFIQKVRGRWVIHGTEVIYIS
ncbi:hypothetical protein LS482_08345 [Sinomicrobium kalidii]|uniref:hypothetical protein n=1 Tax=Sinomicrobium kalidii TaxID=2900738 RepID=UPI001E591E2A|nr:hypothetical protein [Sinomicrobium kalidii]UGU17877.1 hypothetical protein LS482_08345 [Sinomicrobium kalidii]